MIRFVNVSKSFKGRKVLDNLSFDIETNAAVSILGPSGIGKTTILRLITGAISPDSGRVEITAGSKIGYIFQEPRLLPWRTALENVSLGLRAEGMSKKDAGNVAMGWMENLGLKGFENYYPSQLSGGMMQRLSIGRALAIKPDILLMDEPFSNLNVELKESLLDMMEDILGEYRTTVVFVTHDLTEAVRLADKIIKILPGSAILEISPPGYEALFKEKGMIAG